MRGVYEKLPGSGEWWVRFADSTGKIRREKAGTKAAAKQLYQIRKAASLQGQKLPHTLKAKAVTFGDLAKTALEYSAVHKKSVEDDRERMKLLLEWFANTAADTIRPQDIEKRLRDTATERKWKPATVNRYKAVLSLTYRIGLENGRITSNPVRLVRRLREDNHVVRYLTAQEEQRLKAAIEPKHPERWAAVLFALNTGLRAGEQWGLVPKDICLDSVQPQVALSATKNGTVRHVPLNQYARTAVDSLKAGNKPGVRVFPQQSYRGWFELALKAAGIADFTWHCLRHTFASRLVMAGVDLRTVAELMGHKSLQMTMRYAHMAPEHKAAAVDKLVQQATDTKTDTKAKEAKSEAVVVIGKPQLLQEVA